MRLGRGVHREVHAVRGERRTQRRGGADRGQIDKPATAVCVMFKRRGVGGGGGGGGGGACAAAEAAASAAAWSCAARAASAA